MTRTASLLCSTLILATGPVLAFASGEESREMGAHVHGHGALNIALEGNTLAIELRAPGFDIVGFEHVPESDADKQAVEAGLAKLADPVALFALPADAGCEIAEMHVDLRGEEHHEAHEEGHAHQEEHEADHDHEGDHAHGEDHAHDHAHEGEAGHSEFHATYLLACTDASKLTQIDLAYFQTFPNAEELAVQLVTDTGARSLEVSAAAPAIALD